MAPHSNLLAWISPWMEEPGGLQVHGVPKSWSQLSDYITKAQIAVSSHLMLGGDGMSTDTRFLPSLALPPVSSMYSSGVKLSSLDLLERLWCAWLQLGCCSRHRSCLFLELPSQPPHDQAVSSFFSAQEGRYLSLCSTLIAFFGSTKAAVKSVLCTL